MMGGEALQITLTTEILGHDPQINTQRMSVSIFFTIKATLEEIKTRKILYIIEILIYREML